MARRSYGSGSLFVRTDAVGNETWYGRWYAGGKQVQRRIGPKRKRGSREGLTRAQAERELARLIELERPVIRSRLTIEGLGARYLEHLEVVREVKPSTLDDYHSMLRKHFEPFFGSRPIERIDPDQVRGYMAAKSQEGLANKTISNQLNFLHGLFAFAMKRGWLASNAVASTDRPRSNGGDPDIRFLTLAEMRSVVQAIPEDPLGPNERALYLTAAMAGLREGELIALRWMDIDWKARRMRVRRNYTRGRFGTPKSRRSSRSVPIIAEVIEVLTVRREESAFKAAEDLVFGHPQTGRPLDASKMRKRFKAAVTRAGVGRFEVTVKRSKQERVPLTRFHDLRHTFGTRCAAKGVPMRMLQEWMGHRSIATTEIYADYAPNSQEADMLEAAFGSEQDPAADGPSEDAPSEEDSQDDPAPQA